MLQRSALLVLFLPALAFASDQPIIERLQSQIEESKRRGVRTPHFALVGTVESGRRTRYAVNGEDFEVDETTVTIGRFGLGREVQVEGDIDGGVKRATRVVAVGSSLPEPASEAQKLGR